MTPYEFGMKVAIAPQAFSMNDNGAQDAVAAGPLGPNLMRDVNLMQSIQRQGLAKPGQRINPPSPMPERAQDPRPLDRHYTTPAAERAPNPAAAWARQQSSGLPNANARASALGGNAPMGLSNKYVTPKLGK
jgi:hypothetical protein